MGDDISVQVLVSKDSATLTPTAPSPYKYLSDNNGIIQVIFPRGYKNLQYLTITVLSPDKVDVCDNNFIRQDEVFNCTFDRCVLLTLVYDIALICKNDVQINICFVSVVFFSQTKTCCRCQYSMF